MEVINLIVGGLYFCLSVEDIKRFPDSYFAHLLKDEWNADKSHAVVLDRDGLAFRHVHYYIFTGYLDTCDNQVDDFAMLLAVKGEADFYNLPQLVKSCNGRIQRKLAGFCRSEDTTMPASTIYECHAEEETTIVDPLVHAFHPLRYQGIATTQLTSFEHDRPSNMFCSSYTTVTEFVQGINTNHGNSHDSLQHYGHADHFNCVTVSENSLECGGMTKEPISHWPLGRKQPFHRKHQLILVFREGAFCTRRRRGEDIFVYIFNIVFTGGTICATVNGKTAKISQPGECMALCAGASYTVDAVTSGTLILVEFSTSYPYSFNNKRCAQPTWKYCDISDSGSAASPSVYENITHALANDLDVYKGVILCLNSFYPISYTYDSDRRFKTDTDELKDTDAELYDHLALQYHVLVVSVYIKRVATQHITGCCVLDYAPVEPVDDTTLLPTHIPIPQCEKLKVVAPLYGCGHVIDYGFKEIVKGNILTALLVTKRS